MRAAAALMLFASVAWGAPKKAPQRVIFHTIAGDLVFALYPETAPRTVAQFLDLVRHGVYDTCHFRRLEPGFVLQTGIAEDRVIPLSLLQREMIRKLPAEYAADIRHRRGSLSMARPDNDPDGAETSFSILLGNAPHLDGKYTIFGEVESGVEVLGELEKVPFDSNHTPKIRLNVNYAEVVETPAALQAKVLARAIPIEAGLREMERQLAFKGSLAWVGLAVVLLVLVLSSAIAAVLGRGLRPVLFLNALVGGFVLFLYLAPLAGNRPWLATAVFLGSALLFRALSFFESPGPPKAIAQ